MPFDPAKIRKILVIGHSNIGDMSCDLAVIHPLKQYFPHSHISFLTSPIPQTIVEGYPGIDQVITFDRKKGQHKFFERVRFNFVLRKEKFDLVLLLRNTWMYIWMGVPHVWNPRRKFARQFREKKDHPIDLFLSYLRLKGLKADKPVFHFRFQEEDDFCRQLLKRHGVNPDDKIVGILPLSAWFLKNWPIEYWNELAGRLTKDYGMKVVALGTSMNTLYGQRVRKEMSGDIISLLDQTSLRQAMALCRHFDYFVGPDSSFLHMSSLFGVETIGLYGPTPAGYVYPYFHKHNLLTPPAKPAGRTCFDDPHHCSCRDRTKPADCMYSITVEDVLRKFPR